MVDKATALSLLATLSLLVTVLASPTVVNNSPIKIPLLKRYNFTGTSIVKSDQARLHYLKNRHLGTKSAQDPAINVGITNAAVSYIAQVCRNTLS